ncbi:MAG: TIM barrel protein [Cytophagales bacterium]
MDHIYISSLAMMNKPLEEMIHIAKERNWALEFSSGIPFRKDAESLYLDATIDRIPHNYFPAPEVPFVLNLASANYKIRRQSIEHCKNGLWLAKKSNAPFFSAHAGFCIDPDPRELGKKINFDIIVNKEENKTLFLKSVIEILQQADLFGVDFLIENNVIASFNLTNQKGNPLLCCESKEIRWLFEEIKHKRLGLLLDTAHLKVSCKTLELDLIEEYNNISNLIRGLHHSDNDGLVDDNRHMLNDYWFLPYLKDVTDKVQVIEVKNIDNETIQQQVNLLVNGY